MAKKTIPYINNARGIGILLVVLGHALVPQMRANSLAIRQLYGIIYSFHMAFYAMLSGYLFQQGVKRYKQAGGTRFTLNKFRGLMVPYFSYSVVSYVGINLAFLVPVLANILFAAGYAPTSPLQAVLQVLTVQNHIDKHLWFLYALFFVFLLSYFTGNLLRHPVGLLVTLALFVLADFLPLPDVVYRIFYLLPFFSFARQTKWVDTLAHPSFLMTMPFIFLVLYTIRATGWLTQPVVARITDAFIALAGAIVIFAFAALLKGRLASRVLGTFSRHSMAIYILHQPFIVSGVSGVLLKVTPLPYAAIIAIALCLGLALPILANKFVLSKVRVLGMLFLGNFPQKPLAGAPKSPDAKEPAHG